MPHRSRREDTEIEPISRFDSLNENRSEPLIREHRLTQPMSARRLRESIEQKVQAARGSKTATPKKPAAADNSIIKRYKFISTKDYRDFFNSLSPAEAKYLQSPIPPDIRPQPDGSVVIGFRFPS